MIGENDVRLLRAAFRLLTASSTTLELFLRDGP